MRKIFTLLALLAFSTLAIADTKISALPAGAALTGAESMPAVQSAVTVKTTTAAIATYVASTLSLPLAGNTASLGGGALGAGACTSGTATVTGATTAMTAVASPVSYPGDGNVWLAYVSGSNTVTVKVCSIPGGTPTASVYRVRVLQ
jgi:hypothetical protein